MDLTQRDVERCGVDDVASQRQGAADHRPRYVYTWRNIHGGRWKRRTVEEDFALRPFDAAESPGPFIRTRDRGLTIWSAVTRQSGFPANGVNGNGSGGRVRYWAAGIV